MKRYLNVFFLIFLTISIVFGSGPKGNSLARAKNDHSGNKIRTTFYNYGLVGRWTSEPEDIGGEWPINSGVYGFPVQSFPIELIIQFFPPTVVRKLSVWV